MAITIETKNVATAITSSPTVGWGTPFRANLITDAGPSERGWRLQPTGVITNKAQATALIELLTVIRDELER